MATVTLLIGAGVLAMFGTLFYLEDRTGGGLYDPNSVNPRNRK
jgi:hypothetical protein